MRQMVCRLFLWVILFLSNDYLLSILHPILSYFALNIIGVNHPHMSCKASAHMVLSIRTTCAKQQYAI